MKEIILGALGEGLFVLARFFVVWLASWLMRLLPKGKIESGLICFKHRSLNREWFESTLRSELDVLMLTTMSDHTLTDIEGYFRDGKINVQRLRVLTLSPNLSDDIVGSIARHLGESSQKVKEQIPRAYQRWRDLEINHSALEVRSYSTLPTLHAVFRGDESADIELLTYQTVPSDRASLFFDSKQNRVALDLFKSTAEKLWNDSREPKDN